MYIVYTDAYDIGLCKKRTTLLARSKIRIMLYYIIPIVIVYGSYTYIVFTAKCNTKCFSRMVLD